MTAPRAFRTGAVQIATTISIALLMSCGGGSTIDGPTLPTPVAPSFSAQPSPAQVQTGQAATFNATVVGYPTPTLQWRRNGADIAGATSATYVTSPTTHADSGAVFTLLASNSVGSLTSAAVTLTVVPPSVATVTVSPAPDTLLVSRTVQLTAALKDASGADLTGRAIAWLSSDTSLATVSASGLVTTRAAGNATISALSEGKTGSAAVVIQPVPVAKVVISPAALTLLVGQTSQLTASAKDSAGGALPGRVVTWTSSDTTRATVSAKGLVSARQAGTVTITALSEGKSATATLTIAPVPVATISISGIGAPQDSLTVGLTRQLAATLRDSTGSILIDRPVVWTSADTSIASISQTGLVTARAIGTALLSATSEGHTAQEYIRVRPAVATVAITPVRVSLVGGSTQQYQVVLRDTGGGVLQRPVTWTSSAPSIVAVSPSGVATVASNAPAGPVTITATSEGHSGTATINVYQTIPVASVTVSPNPVSLAVGGTTQLSAVPRDPFGDTSPLFPGAQWSSSNAAVATVSSNGLVTAIATGSATITAKVNEGSGSSTVTVSSVAPASFAYAGSYPLTIPIPVTSGGGISPTPVFQVTGSDGRPFPGATVTASISQGASLSGNVVTTDLNGLASFAGMVVMGPTGAYNISYSAAGVTGGITFQIALTATTQDVTPPQVVSLTFAPDTLNIANGPASTTATLRVTDAGSGFRADGSILSLQSPAGTSVSCVGVTLVSGTANDGVYTCALSISKGAATGRWTPAMIAKDVIGNTRIYSAGDLSLLSGGVVVVGPAGDVTPPSIVNLSFAPDTLNIAGGPASTTATLRATDAGSGFQADGSILSLQSPAGTSVSCVGVNRVSGTANDGIYTCALSIPQGAATGRWTPGVLAKDAIGNTRIYSASDLAALSAGIVVTAARTAVATVVVSPVSANLLVGQTVQLTAVAKDSVGGALAGRVITWTSGDTARATVSATGLVSARQPGAVTISATSEGMVGSATVTVANVPVASILIVPWGSPFVIGKTYQLLADVFDSTGTRLTGRVITWASSDTTVAAISAAGLLTPLKVGTVTITATSEGKSHSPTFSVVGGASVATVSLTPVRVSLVGGSAQQYQVVLRDTGGGVLQRPVTWTSSAPSIVAVSPSGVATVASNAPAGPVTITATSEGHSGTATINVYQTIPVASVTVSPNPVSLAVGGTTQLSAVPRDPFGDTSPLFPGAQWSSSNAAVATVSSNGLVTAIATGSATITAKVNEGSGSSTVTVSSVAPVAAVTITPSTATVVEAQTTTLAATAMDSTGATLAGRTIAWSSNATDIATVSAAGVVTAVSPGTATITATSEGKSGAATITVTAATAASISVAPASASIVFGSSVTLTATAKDASGNALSGRTFVWTASGPNTSASQGATTGTLTPTFTSEGVATFTATIGAVSGSSTVTVTRAPVTAVAITPPSSLIQLGQTATLTAAITVAGGGTGRIVTWTSSNTAIATVPPSTTVTNGSSLATVTTVGPGTATITATCEGISSTSMVTVTSAASVTAALHVVVIDSAGAVKPNFAVRSLGGALATDSALTFSIRGSAAVVSSSGTVTGRTRGQAMLVARSVSNPNVADSVLVVVAAAGQPVAMTSLSKFNYTAGDTGVTVTVVLDMRQSGLALGSANIQVNWDPSLLSYSAGIAVGSANVVTNGSLASSGIYRMAVTSTSGATGQVQIRELHFNIPPSARGLAGSFTVTLLDANDVNGNNILPNFTSVSHPLGAQ